MAFPKQAIDEIDVQYVRGVGEVRALHLKKAGIYTVQDLLDSSPFNCDNL